MKKLLFCLAMLLSVITYSQKPRTIYRNVREDSMNQYEKYSITPLRPESSHIQAANYRDKLIQYQERIDVDKKYYLVLINGWPSRRNLTKINPYTINKLIEKDFDLLLCYNSKAPRKVIMICLNE